MRNIIFIIAAAGTLTLPSVGHSKAPSKAGPGDAGPCLSWHNGTVKNSCDYAVSYWLSYPNGSEEADNAVDRYNGQLNAHATDNLGMSGIPDVLFWWACRTENQSCRSAFDTIRPSANSGSYSAGKILAANRGLLLHRGLNAAEKAEWDRRTAAADALGGVRERECPLIQQSYRKAIAEGNVSGNYDRARSIVQHQFQYGPEERCNLPAPPPDRPNPDDGRKAAQ